MIWIVFVAAVCGAVFNIYKRPEGFVIWLITNAFWIYHNYTLGETAQACQYIVFFLLSAGGLWTWTKSPSKKEHKI